MLLHRIKLYLSIYLHRCVCVRTCMYVPACNVWCSRGELACMQARAYGACSLPAGMVSVPYAHRYAAMHVSYDTYDTFQCTYTHTNIR